VRRGTAIALFAIALFAIACGGALAEGRAQFDKGRYPEAKQTFASIEQDAKTWPDAKRAEYALYRGLTHAALNDNVAAGIWLKEAKAIVDVNPAALSAEDAQRLRLGLEQVGP
jgi:hypothetical protein